MFVKYVVCSPVEIEGKGVESAPMFTHSLEHYKYPSYVEYR